MEDAIQRIRSTPFDLVVTDHGLHLGRTGLDLIAILKIIKPEMLVIMMLGLK